MICKNKFCIYQTNDKCKFEKAELDSNGTCKSCIYIKIEDDILENLKKESFDDILYFNQEKSKKLSSKLYFD
jgi:NADH:ubiquinone oxidoreductase subunit E